MASKTRATELKRIRRNSGMGKRRKAKANAKGTTLSKAKLFGDEK